MKSTEYKVWRALALKLIGQQKVLRYEAIKREIDTYPAVNRFEERPEADQEALKELSRELYEIHALFHERARQT